ncbi:MAG TPA: hypothetical protein PKA13_10375, partial [Geminicoccaceae bacterium]|nr:hypothetical protein [Geminicoccus sp.]HMU50171.1 hypothetical protein [Geminicoccaceae bacterium]
KNRCTCRIVDGFSKKNNVRVAAVEPDIPIEPPMPVPSSRRRVAPGQIARRSYGINCGRRVRLVRKLLKNLGNSTYMAEGMGFEPTIGL